MVLTRRAIVNDCHGPSWRANPSRMSDDKLNEAIRSRANSPDCLMAPIPAAEPSRSDPGGISGHAARHEAANMWVSVQLNRPDHRHPGSIGFCHNGIFGNIDPFIIDPNAIMAVMRFPVDVRKRSCHPRPNNRGPFLLDNCSNQSCSGELAYRPSRSRPYASWMASRMTAKVAHDLIHTNIGISHTAVCRCLKPSVPQVVRKPFPTATPRFNPTMWLDRLSQEWLPPASGTISQISWVNYAKPWAAPPRPRSWQEIKAARAGAMQHTTPQALDASTINARASGFRPELRRRRVAMI